jgi:hypothetical protein
MDTKGTFGYIIGRKRRFMKVEEDADLFWQILVREIYVIRKNFENKESMQEAFEKIKPVKVSSPINQNIIEKCKPFTNLISDINDWSNLLYFCQNSFINLLESEYILLADKEEEYSSHHFEFDFNKWEARFYWKNNLLESASLEEIMEFDEMPTKTYKDIVSDMKNRFTIYYEKINDFEIELDKLNIIKVNTQSQGAANIEEKINKLIDDTQWEIKKLHLTRREVFNRLKNLDLLEEDDFVFYAQKN